MAAAPADPSLTPLGELIREQNDAGKRGYRPETGRKPPKRAAKTYGAKDRRALDSLFETTGGSGK